MYCPRAERRSGCRDARNPGTGRGSDTAGTAEVLAELSAAGIEINSQEDSEAALAEHPELRARLEATMRSRGEPQRIRTLLQRPARGTRWRTTIPLHRGPIRSGHGHGRLGSDPDHSGFQSRIRVSTRAVVNDAGGTFLGRYRAHGHMGDLERAFELWQQAAGNWTPPDSPERLDEPEQPGQRPCSLATSVPVGLDLMRRFGCFSRYCSERPRTHPTCPQY